jgi:hypothetical protein
MTVLIWLMHIFLTAVGKQNVFQHVAVLCFYSANNVHKLNQDQCLLGCCAVYSDTFTDCTPWWRRQEEPLKRRYISTTLHGTTSQKTVIFMHVDVRTWNLTRFNELRAVMTARLLQLRVTDRNTDTELLMYNYLLNYYYFEAKQSHKCRRGYVA